MARASASARWRSARRMWKASRWAVLGPTPGSRESSWIRSSTAWGNSGKRSAHQAGRQPQAGGHRLHALGGHLTRLLERLVEGSHHQVLQHLGVGGEAGVDGHRHDLLRPRHHGLDGAAARRGLYLLGLQVCLDLGHLGLHLLDLLEHLHGVLHYGCDSLTLGTDTFVTRPSSWRTARCTISCSSGAVWRTAVPVTGAPPSWRRYSTFTPAPSQPASRGSSLGAPSTAFWWWKA